MLLQDFIWNKNMRGIESSLYVFEHNYLQLKKLLDVYMDKEKALTLWSNPGIQDSFHLEVMRLLHNYVASVKSLVDHTRMLYRQQYGEKNSFPEYVDEVNKRFAQNPLAQFIEDLREYCLHYKHLPIASSFNYVQEPPKEDFCIILDREALKKYSRWSSFSKAYLKMQKKDINLTNLITQYYNLVIEFHKWIRSKQPNV